MMRPALASRQHGASRLELCSAGVLLAILSGLLLNCLIRYRGESEQVAAKQLIGSLRTALAVQSAKVISTTGEAGLLALAHQNPMTWLQRPPANYLGEYYSPNKAALPAGNWYFDRATRALVYLPVVEKSFSVQIQKVLMFKVELLRVPGLVNTHGQGKGTTGLVLDQISGQTLAFNTIAGSISRPSYSEKK